MNHNWVAASQGIAAKGACLGAGSNLMCSKFYKPLMFFLFGSTAQEVAKLCHYTAAPSTVPGSAVPC